MIINLIKPYETIISESYRKGRKSYKRKIKMHDNIEIQVNVQYIKQIGELIKVGYDESTNCKFNKTYLDVEK
jgi:hypothetical protein